MERMARLIVIALAVVMAACPGRTKRQVGANIPLPTDGDQRALKRFQEARARFQAGGTVAGDKADRDKSVQAAAEFEAIARDYPEDPIAPHALLYAGISALDAGQPDRAVETLGELVRDAEAEPAVKARGQLFYGIALGATGKHDKALAALEAGREAVDRDNPDEVATYHAAGAEANAATGRSADAIAHYDAWYAVGRAAERAYARARIGALTDALAEADVARAYERLEGHGGPGAALVGARLAAQHDARGDHERAKAIREEIAGAREKLGLLSGGASGGSGDAGNPDRVGAILSLSGKRNQLGDLSMRGLALASGSFDDALPPGGNGLMKPFHLSVRDDGSQAGLAGEAVDVLAAEGVIAIVGPDDGKAVERAARRATELGVPLVSLHPAANLLNAAGSPQVFHVVHSAEQRAQALARRALAAGVRDFAILGPDNGFGRKVGEAFAAEAERGGGQVVMVVRYKPGTTTFADEVKKLKKPFQALFVPDRASALELVAPALAAGNLMARPPGEKTKVGRAFWLLSTADLVTPRFLRAAGRYAWGALLAPGFFADRTDARIGEFALMYERSFGREPTALDAYAFDAAWAIRAAVDGNARSRRDVAAALAVNRIEGLTGKITFDSGHRRSDDGVLYEVVQVRAEQFEIRARR